MSDNKLYVIGNGFDLHHGIASKFSDFRLFLEEKERELCEKIEEYLCGLEGNWANLEEALSAFDYDTVLDHASDLLVSYAAEDWSDSFHHDYQYEINEIVQALSKKLKGSFVEWLQLISVPTRSQALASLVEIEVEGKFMNFNYTPTLQKVYGVAPDRILHVHGSLNSGANSIVLGHGWAPTDRQSLNAIAHPENLDPRVLEGNELIEDYFEATFKPTDQIISQNAGFFSSLSNTSEIFVWGHSLSEVDMPYFFRIEQATHAQSPIWNVSYYNKESIDRNTSAISQLGVPASRVRHHRLSKYAARTKT